MEIILNNNLQISSLFRTPNLEEAEVKFCVLKDKLPVFIEISKEVCYNRLFLSFLLLL